MKIDKIVKITLEPEEVETLQRAGGILREVCNEFNDCEDCPLQSLCDTSRTYPHTLIEEFAIKHSKNT